MRIDGGALAAATQTLFAKTATPVVPASAVVSVEAFESDPVPLDERRNGSRTGSLTPSRRIRELASMVGDLEVNAPEVTIGADSDEAARVYRAYSAHRSNLMAPTSLI